MYIKCCVGKLHWKFNTTICITSSIHDAKSDISKNYYFCNKFVKWDLLTALFSFVQCYQCRKIKLILVINESLEKLFGKYEFQIEVTLLRYFHKFSLTSLQLLCHSDPARTDFLSPLICIPHFSSLWKENIKHNFIVWNPRKKNQTEKTIMNRWKFHLLFFCSRPFHLPSFHAHCYWLGLI